MFKFFQSFSNPKHGPFSITNNYILHWKGLNEIILLEGVGLTS